MARSVITGRGGVWVLMPPYLLFYPDKNGDDIPDGDPEVHLTGFGLEDTHSGANSLRWGPDGWIYGAHGSTCTAEIQGIKFLGQAVWRYHPRTKKFEVFGEGGGNTFCIDFDSQAGCSPAPITATRAACIIRKATASPRTGASTAHSSTPTPSATTSIWHTRI